MSSKYTCIHDISSCYSMSPSPNSIPCVAVGSNSKAARRWHLAYTLVKNPDLLSRRKLALLLTRGLEESVITYDAIDKAQSAGETNTYSREKWREKNDCAVNIVDSNVDTGNTTTSMLKHREVTTQTSKERFLNDQFNTIGESYNSLKGQENPFFKNWHQRTVTRHTILHFSPTSCSSGRTLNGRDVHKRDYKKCVKITYYFRCCLLWTLTQEVGFKQTFCVLFGSLIIICDLLYFSSVLNTCWVLKSPMIMYI